VPLKSDLDMKSDLSSTTRCDPNPLAFVNLVTPKAGAKDEL